MAYQLNFEFKPVPSPSAIRQLWTPDDIFSHLDGENVVSFLEDNRVERKSARVKERDLGDSLSMWSNTVPSGGLILVGVEDDGRLTGCVSMSQKHKNDLEETRIHCEDAKPVHKVLKVRNHKGEDDYLIAIRVPYHPSKLVETSSGKAFYRQGSSKVLMSDELKQEHRFLKGELHHELETVPLTYPDDFDMDQVSKFCLKYKEGKRIRQPRSNEDVLELARLGKRSSRGFLPNLAGCLLLSKQPRLIIPGSYIRIIRYTGSSEQTGERLNSIFSEIIEGPIPRLIDVAKEVIASQLRVSQKLNSNGRLERRPEYPEFAWLEAIVNAVCHRSYNFKTQPVFVRLFDDCMTVESPGPFKPPVTPDTIYETHMPRNPNLMEAMWYLGFTFMAHEGTNRIKDEMRNAGLPDPDFSQRENFIYRVVVTLKNGASTQSNDHLEEFAGLGELVYGKLSSEEKSIVNYLAHNPSLTVTQATSLIERSAPTATKYLNSLVQKGILNPFAEGRPENAIPKQFSLKRPT